MIRSGVTGIDRSRRIKDPKAVLVGYTHSSTKVVSVETVCQVCHPIPAPKAGAILRVPQLDYRQFEVKLYCQRIAIGVGQLVLVMV